MQKTGEKIKILIRAKGYKQADFAEMIGYNPVSFSKLLKIEPINTKALNRIAKGLSVSVEFLENLGDVEAGNVPAMVSEPAAQYQSPPDRVAALEKENQLLRDELEEMRKRLVDEKLISSDLSEKLRRITKGD